MGDVPSQLIRMAVQHQQAGRFDQARELYQQALRDDPGNVDALNLLAGLLGGLWRFDEMAGQLARVVALHPNVAEAHHNLGVALSAAGRVDEAADCFRRAAQLRPGFAEAHAYLGIVLEARSSLDESSDALHRAIRLDAKHAAALGTLGLVRMRQGLHDEALSLMRASLALKKNRSLHHNLCLLSNYHSTLSGEEVLKIHREWEHDYGAPIASRQPHANDRRPDRPLRIGYVSPDFRSHATNHFVEPVLSRHDREQFRVFCYSHVAKPDHVTAMLRSKSDEWRDTARLSDAQVETMIRADAIDILIDLAGHTGETRLGVFTRRPSPVQVSMIGYPSTTGLSAIDYKISDPHCDPPGAERFYSERLARLDGTFWCFRPMEDAEPIGELPAKRNGYVTFGSANNVSKLAAPVLEIWARIVASVPNARMHMQHSALDSASVRQRIIGIFARHGVGEDRVRLTGWTTFDKYVELLRGFDVALDPFPFNGGTTTCQTLYHGAACVTLAGERQVSRMGVSMLRAIGLDELIAQDTEQYVRKSVELASDIDRLSRLRHELRDRLRASPLCDAAGYTRKLEGAFRQMWGKWCGSR